MTLQSSISAPPSQAIPQNTLVPTSKQVWWKEELLAIVWLAALLLVHSACTIYWLHKDEHIIQLDEAHHVQTSLDYFNALFPETPQGIVSRLLATLNIESPYPPMVHVLGAVAMRLLGPTPDAIALTGSVALVMLLFGVYFLARQGMRPFNAFLVCLLVSLIPMVYGYSRFVMPDTLCGAFIVWTFLGLLKSNCFVNTGWTTFFAITYGLALLSKQTAFLYVEVPGSLVFVWGVVRALVRKTRLEGIPTRWHECRRILVNVVICCLVIITVSGWWYLRHVNYLYQYWSTQYSESHGSVFQPGLASLLFTTTPSVSEAAHNENTHDSTLAEKHPSDLDSSSPVQKVSLWEPYRRYWKRYLFYAVNDAVFLPMIVVCLAGLPTLLLKRNRNALSLLLLLWVVGTYVMLLGVFSIHSPRFLYAGLPPVAFFAAMALDAIAVKRLRVAVWGIFLVVLLLQFINISLYPLGPLRRLEVPLLSQEEDVIAQGNTGLAVFKDVINTGHYSIHPPIQRPNITEQVLESMTSYETGRQSHTNTPAGYQVVSSVPGGLGIDFYVQWQHGIQGPHTLSQAGELTQRKCLFESVKPTSKLPEDTLPELAKTDYVILQLPQVIDAMENVVYFFMKHGFTSIFHKGYCDNTSAHAVWIHVLAKENTSLRQHIRDIFELYALLLRDGSLYHLSDDERKALEDRFTQEVQQYTMMQPVNNQIDLLGIHIKRSVPDWFLIRLLFHVSTDVTRPVRIWLRAKPHPDDIPYLFEEQHGSSELIWDFDPYPPADTWKKNQAIALFRPVMAKSIRYQLAASVASVNHPNKPETIIESEWIDFSKVH